MNLVSVTIRNLLPFLDNFQGRTDHMFPFSHRLQFCSLKSRRCWNTGLVFMAMWIRTCRFSVKYVWGEERLVTLTTSLCILALVQTS